MFVALVIVLWLFGFKLWKQENWELELAFLVSGGAAVLTYIGLAWAFRFDLNRDGWLKVLPQPAIFVFGTMLFQEIFFFQQFERVYEAVIFGILLVIYGGVLTAVFLTANVLNVSTVKKIPLLQAAQTSSYLISLFSVYVVSFSIITSGLELYFVAPILFATYVLVIFMHLSHFDLGEKTVRMYALGIAWCALGVVLGLLLWPLEALFVSLIPTVLVYIGIGVVMHKARKTLTSRVYVEYVFVALFILLIVLTRAKWGIGSYFWM